MDLLLALQLSSAAIAAQGAMPDSAAMAREVRAAQQRFESVRRSNLPLSDGAAARLCEARIGRFCYWQDGDDDHPPEPPRITRGRDALVATLDRAVSILPADPWVHGQRVRYLVEAQRAEDALRASAECGGEPWWCLALRGLAYHSAGDHASANSSFDLAMEAAPRETRCQWSDVSPLLEDPHRARHSRRDCGQRLPLDERFWLLSQPLYLLGANDLRSEHFARHVMSQLEAQAAGAYDVNWGGDVHELILRYGWPTSWSRVRESPLAGPGFARIIGHEPVPNWQFAVSGRMLAASFAEATEEDWTLRPKVATSRYASPYARSFRYLPHQLTRFVRGDSLLLIASVDATGAGGVSEGASTAIALVTADSAVKVVSAASRAGRAVMTTQTAAVAQVASVELLDLESKVAMRARYGISPIPTSGRLMLSDLLLHAPVESAGSAAEEIAPFAIGTTTLSASRHPRIAVFWESYGLRPGGEPAEVILAMERTDVRWIERAASRLGVLRSITRPLQVRWQDVPGRDGGYNGRSLTIDVSSIRPGRYLLSVTVTVAGGHSASSERLVEIEP